VIRVKARKMWLRNVFGPLLLIDVLIAGYALYSLVCDDPGWL
jgi:hypothetical protein